MTFVAPIKFEEARAKLGARLPIGAQLSSEQWSAVPVALRERAMFSATVESIRFLQTMKTALADFLEGNRESETIGIATRTGEILPAPLKVGSRAAFIQMMRRKAIAEGLGPIDPEDAGTIKDVTSEKRLGLMFDINTRAARDFGDRKQGLDPDVLNEFPAQRFIRVQEVKTERESHIPFENIVALKTDLAFWLRINQDFGVPWAPWGWGCGHDVEDVDRTESDALGLTHPGERVPGGSNEDFNDHLAASVKNLDPELQSFLREKFGEQISIENGQARWNPQPIDTAPLAQQIQQANPPDDPPARDWETIMQPIVDEYETARPLQKDKLIEQARVALEIPARNRFAVPVETDRSRAGRAVQQIARVGNEQIIARFVRPSLTSSTSVRVHQTSDNRAFYRADINGVFLNVHSGRSTAAHEIMHAIEVQHPEILRKAAQFLLDRARESEKPQPLRKLTGEPYNWSERAIEDDWVQRGGRVYAGKVYSDEAEPQSASDLSATEVLTMGIERMQADPIDFFNRDPDWFRFIIEAVGIGKTLGAGK